MKLHSSMTCVDTDDTRMTKSPSKSTSLRLQGKLYKSLKPYLKVFGDKCFEI